MNRYFVLGDEQTRLPLVLLVGGVMLLMICLLMDISRVIFHPYLHPRRPLLLHRHLQTDRPYFHPLSFLHQSFLLLRSHTKIFVNRFLGPSLFFELL